MNGSFRQSMTWLHTWSSLVFCWLLYLMFVTGTLGYFDAEIDQWMSPETPPAKEIPSRDAVEIAQRYLAGEAQGAQRWFIRPAQGRETPHLRVFWEEPEAEDGSRGEFHNVILDVDTGKPLAEPRDTTGAQTLYRMHYRLHYFPGQVGFYLMAIVTMMMFVGLITGVIAHKRIFTDFFTFRFARGQRSWLDMHNLLAVATLPFQFMITYSGLLFTVFLWMPFVALGAYGFDFERLSNIQDEIFGEVQIDRADIAAPLVSLPAIVEEAEQRWNGGRGMSFINVYSPGDANARVQVNRDSGDGSAIGDSMVFSGSTGEFISRQDGAPNAPLGFAAGMIALHEGLFAGPLLRWLYFLTGLLGCVMIAAGAIYWVVKRKPKTHNAEVGIGYRFVEHMNVATITGLLVAIGVFFWANRLLPIDMENRADWEIHCLFIAWGLMFIHALFRPLAYAWREQCLMIAVVLVGLPIVNAAMTDVHLGTTIASGDWARAGFDLTAAASGVIALLAAKLINVAPSTVGVGSESTKDDMKDREPEALVS